MSDIKYKVDFGVLEMADFEANTKTYVFENDFTAVAGKYAILEKNHFEQLVRALRSCVMSMQVHPDCETNSEFDGFVNSGWEALENVLELTN